MVSCAFEEARVEALLGVRGRWVETEYDEGHPEDRRRYYLVPAFGLQMLIGDGDVVGSIFFMLDGDGDVSPYAWTFDHGPKTRWTRADALAWYGTPSRSGPPQRFAPGGWDRFDHTASLGTIHFVYADDELRLVSTITLISRPT